MEQFWPERSSISRYSPTVYCCSFATLGSPLTVCMPPAACHVEPDVSSARSISSTSFHPAFVKWYKTLAPTTPPPITTTRAWLLMSSPRTSVFRSIVGNCQVQIRSGRRWGGRTTAETLDQPRAEQRDRRVAEALGMGDQIIAIAIVDADVERPHEPPRADLLLE